MINDKLVTKEESEERKRKKEKKTRVNGGKNVEEGERNNIQ